MTVADAPLHRIREVRLEKGWSQERLAQAIGVERTHVVRLETRTYEPRLGTLILIANALGVTLTDLLNP